MMDSSSSLYMCFPCYQLFSSLEEVLSHQLTCHPADSVEQAVPAVPPVPQAELLPQQCEPPGLTQDSLDKNPCSTSLVQQMQTESKATTLQHGNADEILHVSSVQSEHNQKQTTPGSVPLIRYQCGDCRFLFESLSQWQQHRKLGHCSESAEEPGEHRQEQNLSEPGEQQVKGEAMEMEQRTIEDTVTKGGATPTADSTSECEVSDGAVSQDHSYLTHFVEHEVEGDRGLEGAEVVETKDPDASENLLEQTVEADPVIVEAEIQDNSCSSGKESADSQSSCVSVLYRTLKNNEPSLASTGVPIVSGQNFLCVCCGSGFGSETALVTHRKTRHGLEEALHHCSVCGENFMNTTLFLYHRRQHREQAVSSSSPGRPFVSSSEVDKNSNLETTGWPTKAGEGSGEEIPCQQRVEDASSTVSPLEQSTSLLCSDVAAVHLLDGAPSLQCAPLPHLCPHCDRAFGKRCQLRVHLLSHAGEKRFNCDTCPRAFSYKSNLTRHRRAHLGARPYSCQLCCKSFTQSGSLKQHLLIHSKAEGEGSEATGAVLQLPHVCTDCHAHFKTRAQLLIHRQTHTGELPFPCSTCGLSFLRRKQLQLHFLTHQGILSCPHCSGQFSSQCTLDVHLQGCTESAGPGRGRGRGRGRHVGQLECEMCGHRCVTMEGLELHRLSHSGKTPLRCPLPSCRRRFLTSSSLEEHVLAHCEPLADAALSKPRPFHCEHCGKDFTTASSLSVHLRIHTGERPYQCTQCGKRFRQIPHLRDHERLHSGVRPFSCEVCGKSFVLAARLAEHARTHSGEKPYTCPLCPRAFRSLSNLGKHRKTHNKSPTSRDSGSRDEGEAAVRTILLVQAVPSGPEGVEQPSVGAVPPTVSLTSDSPSPLILLTPSVSVNKEAEGDMVPIIQHAIEVIVEETV